MCASIVEDPIYVLSAFGVPESSAGLPVRFVAGAGSAIGYMDGLKLSWPADVPEGQGPTGIALRRGTPLLMRVSRTDPFFALWRAPAAQYGIRSCVTVPCHSGGRIAGVLVVYASEPDVFGPDELQLFERLSDEIGLSMKAKEDRVRLQAAEARLDVLVQDGPGVLFQDQLSDDGTWQRNYISPNVAGLTGYRPEQCVGTMPAILASAEAAELDVWHTAVLQARHADGRNIWASCSLKARRLHSGGWLLTGYMIDVTRERQITEALEQTRRFLEDATASGPGWLYQLTLFPGEVAHRLTERTKRERRAEQQLPQAVAADNAQRGERARHRIHRQRIVQPRWVRIGEALHGHAKGGEAAFKRRRQGRFGANGGPQIGQPQPPPEGRLQRQVCGWRLRNGGAADAGRNGVRCLLGLHPQIRHGDALPEHTANNGAERAQPWVWLAAGVAHFQRRRDVQAERPRIEPREAPAAKGAHQCAVRSVRRMLTSGAEHTLRLQGLGGVGPAGAQRQRHAVLGEMHAGDPCGAPRRAPGAAAG